MQVALYARVSTSDKGQDAENQLMQLREYAKKSGYEIVAEYQDNVSGSGKVVRVQFEEMFVAAYQKKFDLILFWSLDRFTREGIEVTFKLLNQLNDYDVKWKSFTEPYLDTSGMAREIIIAVLAAIAKQERIRLGERVKAGMAKAKLKGVRLGRKLVTEEGRKRKGRLVPVVSINDVVRLKDEGKSLRQIAQAVGISKDSVAKLLSTKGQMTHAA